MPGAAESSFRRMLPGAAFLVAVALVTLAPVLYVLVASFDVAPPGKPLELGLDGWREIFSSPRTWDAIAYSFILAIRVPIAVVVGFAIAWLLVRIEIPGAR